MAAECVAALEAAGGGGAGSPREAALEADIMITSLPSAAAFRDVMSGNNGIAAALKELGYDKYASAEAFPWPDSDAAAKATIDAFNQHLA